MRKPFCFLAMLLMLVPCADAENTSISGILEMSPMVSSDTWAFARLESGTVLCSRGLHSAREIASLSKIMTARVVLSVASQRPAYLSRYVSVSEQASSMIGTSAMLQSGDRLTILDLLYGMLLPSGNDAAVALAEYVGRHLDQFDGKGNLERFVQAMNDEAQGLGMGNSFYEDVHGLGGNVSTPHDLLALTRVVLSEPLFREIVSTATKEVNIFSAGGETRGLLWRNTNKLLEHRFYEGVKTGHTVSAGGSLVLLGTYEQVSYMGVVLASANERTRFSDAFNLFHWLMHNERVGYRPMGCD